MNENKSQAAKKEIEREKRQKRITYRTLDAILYRELCEWIKSYPAKRKRLDEIMVEITGKCSQSMRYSKGAWKKIIVDGEEKFVHEQHLLSSTGGGEKTTQAERASQAYEVARKKYYSLFEDVEAVEKAIEYIRIEHQDILNTGNSCFGERLAKAIMTNCTKPTEYTRTALIDKFNLSMHENTFTWHKRLFIGKLAELRGLIGLLEIWV